MGVDKSQEQKPQGQLPASSSSTSAGGQQPKTRAVVAVPSSCTMQMNKKSDNGYGVKKATAVKSYTDMLSI